MKPLDKKWFVKKIYEGVRIVAMRHAVDSMQAKDFMQEGLIAAMSAIDKYRDRNTEDVIKLISRSAYNRIVDAQRDAVRYHARFSASTENIEYPIDSHEEEVNSKLFLESLSRRLSAVGKSILREKLAPSDKLLQLSIATRQHKESRRQAGKLVMSINPHAIPDSLIAEKLKISKATMSRELKRIREQAGLLIMVKCPEQIEV